MIQRLLLMSCVSLGAQACLDNTPPPAAPEALDDNLRWFWVNGATASDDALRDAATKLAVAGKADSRAAPLQVALRQRLESGDVMLFGLTDVDPAAARGLMVLNVFDCSLARLQAILVEANQAAQYTDVYESYQRTYTTDVDAFVANTNHVIDWTVDVKAALPINEMYTSRLVGGLRRVPAIEDSATPGTLLIARTFLTAPAVFENPTDNYFRQDYQIEVFWQQSENRIFHAYALWREMKAVGLSMESDGLVNLILENLVKWDTRTAELCAR